MYSVVQFEEKRREREKIYIQKNSRFNIINIIIQQPKMQLYVSNKKECVSWFDIYFLNKYECKMMDLDCKLYDFIIFFYNINDKILFYW